MSGTEYITRIITDPRDVALVERHRDFFLVDTGQSSAPRKKETCPESERAFEEQDWAYWKRIYLKSKTYKGSV